MFRYASFNRPLWLCFDPGVSYKIVDIKESDKINGRTPHNVIETEERISPEKLYSLELTSYEEVEAKNRLYIYAKSKFTGRYLDNINYLIHFNFPFQVLPDFIFKISNNSSRNT